MNGTSVIGDVLNKAAATVKAFPPTNCKFPAGRVAAHCNHSISLALCLKPITTSPLMRYLQREASCLSGHTAYRLTYWLDCGLQPWLGSKPRSSSNKLWVCSNHLTSLGLYLFWQSDFSFGYGSCFHVSLNVH